jgi:D-alanyl-D-alanine dipeptidase
VAASKGCTLIINSANRTYAKQAELYHLYKFHSGPIAAPPSSTCAAPHMTGGTIDTGISCPGKGSCMPTAPCPSSMTSILNCIMYPTGWSRLKIEWWHFEYGTSFSRRSSYTTSQ